MSGHSKWSTIKHQKAAQDQKKGQMFSKLARVITLAAKKGGDPAMNAQLRLAIDAARRMNMPNENVERAIKRGIGEESGASLEEVLFEAYGPQGIALLIEGITDNINRSAGEIRHLLAQYGGKLGESGSVRWMFSQKAVVRLDPADNTGKSTEELTMAGIDAGAQDVLTETNGLLAISAHREKLAEIKKALEDAGIVIAEQGMEWVPQQEVTVEDESARKQFENLVAALDERDDVQNIYSNFRA